MGLSLQPTKERGYCPSSLHAFEEEEEMKIIFSTDDDIDGCAKAAKAAIQFTLDNPEWKKDLLGLRFGEKIYGVMWNKKSITVVPQ